MTWISWLVEWIEFSQYRCRGVEYDEDSGKIIRCQEMAMYPSRPRLCEDCADA